MELHHQPKATTTDAVISGRRLRPSPGGSPAADQAIHQALDRSGPVLFVACAVGKVSMWEATKTSVPFYAAMLVVLGLVTYIPALSLWLPGMFR